MMTTYKFEDFERIAVAIGKDVAEVKRHENRFEIAARWHRMDCKSPRREPPSKQRKKLGQIASSARRLLKHLEVHDPREAADGPGEITILEALASAEDGNEDLVTAATARIGRLVEILEAIEAAGELERRARKAADDVVELGHLIVPRGHHGDAAANNWIASMMDLYRTITDREPTASVGAPEQPNEGIAAGPFIRFLEAAGKPIGLEYSSDAWRKRLRTIKECAPRQI